MPSLASSSETSQGEVAVEGGFKGQFGEEYTVGQRTISIRDADVSCGICSRKAGCSPGWVAFLALGRAEITEVDCCHAEFDLEK